SFGGAEARERIAVLVADLAQGAGRRLERLLPARLTEHRRPVTRIDRAEIRRFRHARPADQRLRQPLRVMRVVEAEASLDAQSLVIRRTVLAGDELDL